MITASKYLQSVNTKDSREGLFRLVQVEITELQQMGDILAWLESPRDEMAAPSPAALTNESGQTLMYGAQGNS